MNAHKIKTCTHRELLDIDQTQSYTAIANHTMMLVLSNRVIAPATRLWLLIRFQQSGFSERETIERPVSWLAQQLNVSNSTIQKWQRLLEKEGFLEIKERRRSNGENYPNRYRATMPKELELEIRKNKKRSNVYTAFTQKVQGANEQGKIRKKKPQNQKESIISPLSEIKQSTIGHTIKESKIACEENVRLCNPLESAIIKRFFKSKSNSLTASGLDWFLKSIDSYQYHISTTGHQLWITGVNQFAIKQLKLFKQEIVEHLQNNNIKINRLLFNIDQRLTTSKAKAKTPTAPPVPTTPTIAPNLCQEKQKSDSQDSHEVMLPAHTFYRLRKRLEATHINGHPLSSKEATDLTSEIGYSILKGALKDHPISKAINISLKLVRENRWQKPKGYPQGGSHE